MIASIDGSGDPVFLFDMALVVLAVALGVIAMVFFRQRGVDLAAVSNASPEKWLTPTGTKIAIAARIIGLVALILGFALVGWHNL